MSGASESASRSAPEVPASRSWRASGTTLLAAAGAVVLVAYAACYMTVRGCIPPLVSVPRSVAMSLSRQRRRERCEPLLARGMGVRACDMPGAMRAAIRPPRFKRRGNPAKADGTASRGKGGDEQAAKLDLGRRQEATAAAAAAAAAEESC